MKNIWVESFIVTLGSRKNFKKRLNELLLWDKPFVTRENDNNDKWLDYDNKVQALEFLLK